MNARLLINLILLGVIALLGAIIYFQPGKSQETKPVLAVVDRGAVSTVTLNNGAELVFRKEADGWRLAEPFAAPVNPIRMESLLGIPDSTSEASYPVKPDELGRFELDPPQATLELGETRLKFGGTDPIDMRRYVLVGETLHLVDDHFFHHLTASATDYVDKQLVPEGARLIGIEIPGLKADRDEQGKWVPTPSDSLADLSELAMVWSTARAIEVKRLDQPPAEGAFIRLHFEGDRPGLDYLILKTEPELILARPDLGLSYEISPEIGRQLLNLVDPEKSADPNGHPGESGPGSEPGSAEKRPAAHDHELEE